jgi:hypothetical protein
LVHFFIAGLVAAICVRTPRDLEQPIHQHQVSDGFLETARFAFWLFFGVAVPQRGGLLIWRRFLVAGIGRVTPFACSRCGVVAMAKHTRAEVLEYILMNLGLLAARAEDADLGSLVYMLEVAAMEAEYQLTGVFPSPKIRR